MTDKLNEVVAALNAATTKEGLEIRAEVIDAGEGIIKIEVEEREEFPIMLDIDEEQMTAIVNLWSQNEVKEGAEAEMMNVMLSMNVALPLSAFAKTGGIYQLFGAMSANTVMENIVEEINVLSDNTLEVVDALSDYLNN
ncbi:MAG: DUF2170 family protein [Pseudomonadota bacterium]